MAVGKIRRIVQSHTQRLETTPAIGIVHGFVPARNLTPVSGHLRIHIRSMSPAFAKTKPSYAAPTRAEASSPRSLPVSHRRAIGWRVIAICARVEDRVLGPRLDVAETRPCPPSTVRCTEAERLRSIFRQRNRSLTGLAYQRERRLSERAIASALHRRQCSGHGMADHHDLDCRPRTRIHNRTRVTHEGH